MVSSNNETGILPAIEACYVIHAAIKEIKRRKNPREKAIQDQRHILEKKKKENHREAVTEEHDHP